MRHFRYGSFFLLKTQKFRSYLENTFQYYYKLLFININNILHFCNKFIIKSFLLFSDFIFSVFILD